jgi:hypothetical protein
VAIALWEKTLWSKTDHLLFVSVVVPWIQLTKRTTIWIHFNLRVVIACVAVPMGLSSPKPIHRTAAFAFPRFAAMISAIVHATEGWLVGFHVRVTPAAS